MSRRHWLIVVGFGLALMIGFARSEPGTGTTGLGPYLADLALTLVVAVIVVLGVLILRRFVARHQQGDEARNEAKALPAEIALQEVAHELTGSIFYDANFAREASLDAIAEMRRAMSQPPTPATDVPPAPALDELLIALKSYNGTSVRGLIDHLKEHDIEVPGAAKAKQDDGQSLLAWFLACRPLPSPEAGVHGAGGVHERRSQSENGHEREGESGGGGEG